MLIHLAVLALIVCFAILVAKRYDAYLKWREHHFLYRVRCMAHPDNILIETGEYPNLAAFWCTYCSWSVQDNLILEERDITRFSDWQTIE